jgi:hypothetical protein
MQGVTSRSWVSFIMWTGAAYRASCMACISGLRCEPVHICYLASDLFIDAVRPPTTIERFTTGDLVIGLVIARLLLHGSDPSSSISSRR